MTNACKESPTSYFSRRDFIHWIMVMAGGALVAACGTPKEREIGADEEMPSITGIGLTFPDSYASDLLMTNPYDGDGRPTAITQYRESLKDFNPRAYAEAVAQLNAKNNITTPYNPVELARNQADELHKLAGNPYQSDHPDTIRKHVDVIPPLQLDSLVLQNGSVILRGQDPDGNWTQTTLSQTKLKKLLKQMPGQPHLEFATTPVANAEDYILMVQNIRKILVESGHFPTGFVVPPSSLHYLATRGASYVGNVALDKTEVGDVYLASLDRTKVLSVTVNTGLELTNISGVYVFQGLAYVLGEMDFIGNMGNLGHDIDHLVEIGKTQGYQAYVDKLLLYVPLNSFLPQ